MSGPGSPVRVVLVEDNPGDVFLIQEALREKGLHFELVHYPDGEEAWQAMTSADALPDLILLDLNLPKIEGVNLLRQIHGHARLAGVPVAVLTSSQSPQDEQQAMQYGAARFIRKSATLDEFLEGVGGAVVDILSARRAETGD